MTLDPDALVAAAREETGLDDFGGDEFREGLALLTKSIALQARLYMESLLNVFYFVMAIYGWWVWQQGASDTGDRPVVIWPVHWHAQAFGVILVCSVVTGFLLDKYTDAAYPYIDSLTTFSSFWATFLVARKVLENWWYWLFIDAVSIFIYWGRDLQLTSVLFVLYVIMIPFGLISWTRSFRAQPRPAQ